MNEYPVFYDICKNDKPKSFWYGYFDNLSKCKTCELRFLSFDLVWVSRLYPLVKLVRRPSVTNNQNHYDYYQRECRLELTDKPADETT